jgi:phenylalanyl-tRNA synthetase alpha chain
MNYQNPKIAEVAEMLKSRLADLPVKADILKAVELKALFDAIPTMLADERATYGKELNSLRSELNALVAEHVSQAEALPAIDTTAPFDINVPVGRRPALLTSENGSKHPLMAELEQVLDIFYRMGFTAVESREIDDDYHMFSALNFPEGHPARDDYDTFMTVHRASAY